MSRSQLYGSSVRIREDPPPPDHEEPLRLEAGGYRRMPPSLLRVGLKWASPSGTGMVPAMGRGRRSSRRFGNPFKLWEGS
jgi:hypothetical protein